MGPKYDFGKLALSIATCWCTVAFSYCTMPNASAQDKSQNAVFSGGASKSMVAENQSSGVNSASWESLNPTRQEDAARNQIRYDGGHTRTTARTNAGSAVVTAAYRPDTANQENPGSPEQRSMRLEPPTQTKTGEGQGTGSSTIQMVTSIGSSLLIVIGLFLGAAWCYKKTINTPLSGGIPNQVVKILGRTPLAPRQQLMLVRFGSKLVLVSLIQGEARTISEITDPVEVDQLAGFCESQSVDSASQSFRNILNQGALK